MKVIAVIDADLRTTPIGTRSRLAEPLGDVPVLRRTVERVSSAQRLSGIHVVCPDDQYGAGADLLAGTAVTMGKYDGRPAPCASLIRAARKWSLDAWRGGVGGATSLDEYINPPVVAAVAAQVAADAVLVVPPAAVFVDPALIDAMIDYFASASEDVRVCFTQAPPGLAATLYRRDFLDELLPDHITPGFVLAYKPDAPQMDLAFKPCCYRGPQALSLAWGRMIVDTRRAWGRADAFLDTGLPAEAESVARWLLDTSESEVPDRPREVEIELTTADQLPDTTARPRGTRVGDRGPLDVGVVMSIAEELAGDDDALVVLGGYGEPLLHPNFADIVGGLRAAGVYGIAVRTNGIDLSERMIHCLISHRVDVLNVLLDAWRPETYRRVQRGGSLATVTDHLGRLMKATAAARQVEPLIVPEITKMPETMDDIEEFFDGWDRKVGWASIVGYSHHGGRLEDHSVMDMSPPTRVACRRIRNRCLVLADGAVTLCDQDFAGSHPAGSLHDTSLGEIWRGSTFRALRDAHAVGRYDAMAMCPACAEWHRP